MKYLPLIWAGIWRKPTRTLLTLASVSVAFVLFGLLHGVVAGFESGIQQLSDTRLRVQSRAGILTPLPLAHLNQIENVDGVQGVGYMVIFPAYFREQTNPIGAGALKADRFFQGFPDIELSDGAEQSMLINRRGAIIGEDLAVSQSWQIGDVITLSSAYWSKADGSLDWEFEIVGISNWKNKDLPANELWVNYEYLDESRAHSKGTVHMFFVTFNDPEQAGRISEAIDKRFMNTPFPTVTQMEQDWLRSRIEEIGSIQFFVNAIIGAVLFTLLFVTGNTMMQSVRERIPELAVLKTYGFSNRLLVTVVFAEAALVCLLAVFIGLGIAASVYPNLFGGLGLGKIAMPVVVLRDGVLIGIALAAISTVPPAVRAQGVSIVEGLAMKQR